MYLLDNFFLERVLYPFAGTPFLDLGCPPEALPSPPPIGWSTGFIATPLVLGRRPNHLLLPAFPDFCNPCSELDTVPIVAKQVSKTNLLSPLGNFNVAYFPSLATICTLAPALLANEAPLPGIIQHYVLLFPMECRIKISYYQCLVALLFRM